MLQNLCSANLPGSRARFQSSHKRFLNLSSAFWRLPKGQVDDGADCRSLRRLDSHKCI
jgi:hypothetical protein